MKTLYKYILVACWLFSFDSSLHAQAARPDLTAYVDPFIGTGLHGHVFLGASVPFGAVQMGPVNISKGWDWCSGYNYSDSTIVGFAHTHLSGTGIGDLGDIEFMPTTGPLHIQKEDLKDSASGSFSLFSHRDERAEPGYYSVKLKRYPIRVELTATTRVGYHRYTFPASDQAHIIINLQDAVSNRPLECFMEKINDSTITGYRITRGWATNRRIYFAAIFSRPIKEFTVYDNGILANGISLKAKNVKGVLSFTTSANEKVGVKVGISPVSIDNALLNIKAEAATRDFDKVKADAKALWNYELQKVRIKAPKERMRTFYTALYHTMIAPSVFNDCNGEYLGADKKPHANPGFENVTTLSLWDIYRAQGPLLTLLQPERVNGLINTMITIYQQQGKLPVWHLMANETDCMVGYSAVPIVADAFLKGYTGFDAKLAYEAVKATAMRDDRGLKFVKDRGFIPADTMVESVATGLEYSIDDWCIAQMARKLGKEDDYQYFSKRGGNYSNYFDKGTGFMRGRVSSTEWRSPFSPFISRHMKDDFTEGNAWQYTWLVPQDVEGLIALVGGEKAFTQKLDSLFIVKGDLGKEASGDISGLIGQYAHGNEPSHHIAYLYAYVGEPYKTAEKVRTILDSFYTNKPDGIIGNEDVGQMSAWYVLSALGFYPVNPANGAYVFGSPVMDEATIQLQGGLNFRITVENNSAGNKYIQSILFNGKPYSRSYFLHSAFIKGGTMQIKMGPGPSASWGVDKNSRPVSKPQ